MTEDFFEQPTEQSIAKATIVSKYFAQWANVMKNTVDPGKPIAYIDLFSGPGMYNDGTKSTPLLVIDEAKKDDKIPKQLVLVFNDKNISHINKLQETVESYQGIDSFCHHRRYWNYKVGEEIITELSGSNFPPTLLFVDPWGVRGLSLDLINSFLEHFGCDVIFFFNYNRVNMGINKPEAIEHLNSIFGVDRASRLLQMVEPLSPVERELVVVEELAQALRESSTQRERRFVLPFRFKKSGGQRTSHHLVFVSKHFRGYEIMKEIMAKESSGHDQGVPSFEYNRATEGQMLLFSLAQPLDRLGEMLMQKYAGQSLTMIDVYEQHSVDTPYIKKNYKEVLWELYDSNRITTNRKPKRRRTFADNIVATFPPTSSST